MVAVAVVLSSHPGCAFLPSIAPISRAGLSVPIAQALPGRCRLPLRARAPLGRGVARMTAAVGAEVDPREFQAKSEVLAALAAVQDPTRGESVVSLRAVSNVQVNPDAGSLAVTVMLSVPDLSGDVKAECEAALKALEWVTTVDVTMAAAPPAEDLRAASEKEASGLAGVKNVVMCASCKGGVGKSTTAVNLAFSLQAMGLKVGILDVDVYGPSLPTMVLPDRPFNPQVDIIGNRILPVLAKGVKMMSIGFINPVDSFVLRGAKVSPLVQQLVGTTDWGELDYLIIDMPPGTGDIHLTLSQMERLRIDAAVIVTTPQRLSFVDVVKGVEMFDKVGIPSVAVVENMAFLDPSEALAPGIDAFVEKHSLSPDAAGELRALVGQRQMLFGTGHRQRLLDMWGIANSYSIPLLPALTQQADAGLPYVLAFPASPIATIFKDLATDLVREVTQLKEASPLPKVTWDSKSNELVIDGAQRIASKDLRAICRSPANDPARVPASIKPVEMTPLGRYALQIVWSDGHQSLMPYRAFVDGFQ